MFAIAHFLTQHPVKLIVVACNTATAAAVACLRAHFQIPIVGLEPALKPAIEFTSNKKVGVLATQATLDSQKYQDLRAKLGKQTKIIEKASPFFVELVESAPVIGTKQLKLIENELQPFIDENVDSLVLGCTHFPFLTQTISTIMGPKVALFESALPVAKEVKRRLLKQSNLSKSLPFSALDSQNAINKNSQIEYYSSAPQKAQSTFELLLGKKITIRQFSS